MITSTRNDVLKFLMASGFIAMFDAVRNIVVANILGPYLTGLCTTILVIPQVGQYMNLGMIDALTVIVPANRGRQQHVRADEIKNIVLSVSMLTSFVLFIIVLFYTLVFSFRTPQTNIYIIFAGFLIILWQAKKFFVTVYAADNHFTKLSWVEVTFSFLVTLMQIILVYCFLGYGFWCGFIIANIIIIIYCAWDYMSNIKNFHLNFNLLEIIKIIPLGIAMIASAVIYAPFVITSRIFLAKTAGVQEVGFFMVAVIIITKMSIIPSAISRVITPKMSFLHAEASNLSASFSLFKKAQAYTFGMAMMVFIVGIIFIEPLVAVIMPSFMPGVPAAKVMLFAGIPYCLIDNANNFLLAHQYKRMYLKVLVGALCFQFTAFAYLHSLGNVTARKISFSIIIVFLLYAVVLNFKVFALNRKAQTETGKTWEPNSGCRK